MDFFSRDRDVYRTVRESHVTTLLPDCPEPVTVAKDLDKLFPFYWPELPQGN